MAVALPFAVSPITWADRRITPKQANNAPQIILVVTSVPENAITALRLNKNAQCPAMVIHKPPSALMPVNPLTAIGLNPLPDTHPRTDLEHEKQHENTDSQLRPEFQNLTL